MLFMNTDDILDQWRVVANSCSVMMIVKDVLVVKREQARGSSEVPPPALGRYFL